MGKQKIFRKLKDNELLEKYDKIWHKVRNSIKKGFDSEPVYTEKYVKTRASLVKVKSTQFFMMMEYQKKVLISTLYQ